MPISKITPIVAELNAFPGCLRVALEIDGLILDIDQIAFSAPPHETTVTIRSTTATEIFNVLDKKNDELQSANDALCEHIGMLQAQIAELRAEIRSSQQSGISWAEATA